MFIAALTVADSECREQFSSHQYNGRLGRAVLVNATIVVGCEKLNFKAHKSIHS